MRETTEPGPDCLSESVTLAAATDRLLTGPGRAWHEVAVTHVREATLQGGGRAWTLRCSVRLEGVAGGRFLASVSLWSGDPEASPPKTRRAPTPRHLEFVTKIQRRLRGMRLQGRFHSEMGDHWPGYFSRTFRGFASLERMLGSLDRLERDLGAVARRTDPRPVRSDGRRFSRA